MTIPVRSAKAQGNSEKRSVLRSGFGACQYIKDQVSKEKPRKETEKE